MNKRWSLSDKKAIVTGGTKGIGAAIVEELKSFGVEVLTVARQVPADATDALAADLSTKEGIETVVRHVENTWGALDILVNNVGMNIRKKTPDYSDDEYDTIMNTNLRSAFDLCKRFYPLLKKSGAGNIVNVSSTGGQTAIRTGSIYGMTKAAMIQLTKNLAVEWAEEGIRVNCVAPWYIRTPLAETVLKNKEYYDTVIGRTPMKKVGNPEDVAAAVAFFCTPAAAFVTGQTLSVDGGFTVFGF